VPLSAPRFCWSQSAGIFFLLSPANPEHRFCLSKTPRSRLYALEKPTPSWPLPSLPRSRTRLVDLRWSQNVWFSVFYWVKIDMISPSFPGCPPPSLFSNLCHLVLHPGLFSNVGSGSGNSYLPLIPTQTKGHRSPDQTNYLCLSRVTFLNNSGFLFLEVCLVVLRSGLITRRDPPPPPLQMLNKNRPPFFPLKSNSDTMSIRIKGPFPFVTRDQELTLLLTPPPNKRVPPYNLALPPPDTHI